jgi:hypothetical protein
MTLDSLAMSKIKASCTAERWFRSRGRVGSNNQLTTYWGRARRQGNERPTQKVSICRPRGLGAAGVLRQPPVPPPHYWAAHCKGRSRCHRYREMPCVMYRHVPPGTGYLPASPARGSRTHPTRQNRAYQRQSEIMVSHSDQVAAREMCDGRILSGMISRPSSCQVGGSLVFSDGITIAPGSLSTCSQLQGTCAVRQRILDRRRHCG